MNTLKPSIIKNIRITILFLAFSIVVNYGYKLYFIKGDSMSPSISSSNLVWVNKFQVGIDEIGYGDVIVFWDVLDEDFLIKRVLGVPGDSVSVVNGDIFINGLLYVDEFSGDRLGVLLVDESGSPLKNWVTGEPVYEYDNMDFGTLRDGEYWVIGDNRKESWYGVVYVDEILGTTRVN